MYSNSLIPALIFLVRVIAKPTVNSDTEFGEYAGTFVALIPNSLQASKSILLVPADLDAIYLIPKDSDNL